MHLSIPINQHEHNVRVELSKFPFKIITTRFLQFTFLYLFKNLLRYYEKLELFPYENNLSFI